MSTDTGGTTGGIRIGRLAGRLVVPRPLALLSAAVLLSSFTAVLYDLTDVVGDPDTLLLLVAGTLAVATLLSRVLRVRTALVIALALLVGGLWTYASALPIDVVETYDRILADVVALLTGLSVLRLQKIELWTLALAPAPVFLTWYLALRRRYVAAVGAGGATLGFFVLSGDVTTTVALFGALGAAGTVGFGRLDRFGGDRASVEVLAVVLAAMVLLTTTVSVVPGGTEQPVRPLGSGGPETVEGSLISTDQRVSIQGAIDLSPERRFTVESDRSDYWRAASYDRYTGDGWVRTGTQTPYRERLSGPTGRTETVTQRYTFASSLDTMPAVWRPVSVTGDAAGNAEVTDAGGLQPASPFSAGDSYTVRSERPVAGPEALASAGTDYPTEVEERYTQLPDSTPERVGERTERITADADTPYETARAAERWLENNRAYSLDVERPEGDVADAFLFEMEAGYCTYYATTMVAMLRSQGVPARFVVGYTPGEQVAEDEWVVRGLDSHAWVEVYFPDVGWVRFDPTPAAARESAERDRLESTGGFGGPIRETPPPTPGEETTIDPNPGTTTESPTDARESPDTDTPASTGGGIDLPDPPSRDQLALGAVVLAGLVAGARRSGLTARAYRALWVRYQPRTSPHADVERAFERLTYLLSRDHRPRRAGETPRQYLAAVDADDRIRRVYEAYERAQYAGDVSESAADEAVELADAVVADRSGWRPR